MSEIIPFIVLAVRLKSFWPAAGFITEIIKFSDQMNPISRWINVADRVDNASKCHKKMH